MFKNVNTKLLVEIVEWFLKAYPHDEMEEIRLNRIIDELHQKQYLLAFDGENMELLKESIRWAEGLDSGCPVDSKDIQDIKQALDDIA